ncbi:hypothetical protein ASD56_03850 [Microbacterium sp. Root166]|nr:hypothetical protein ASD56_03850 [Microbacterium sp. Root166]
MAIALGSALVAAGLLAAPAASADIRTGSAETECQSAGFDTGVKLDTGAPGSYEYDGIGPWEPDGKPIILSVTITDSHTFAWTAAPSIEAVLVKAGSVHIAYPGGSAGGGDLVADHDHKNGISHLTFCWGDDPYDPYEELTVTKTVETSYVRDHDWSLSKSADPAEVWLYAPGGAGSGSADVDWTVMVGYDGATDSGHTVSGIVTVENTGSAAAAVTDLVDTMTTDAPHEIALDCGEVDLSGDALVILAAGDSFSCDYSMATAGPVSGSNTAVATTVSGGSYSSGAEPIAWGDPVEESDRTVTVTDVSDVGGTQDASFTAPDGGSIDYSDTFTWSDYETCGDHVYDNTATLTSEGSDPYEPAVVLDEVTESVTVHVQCLVFDGETAWAANAGPGTLPYNIKKGGNWATYVQYPNTAPVVKTYNVYAGQNMLAGTATVSPTVGGKVTVTVDLMGDWEFAEVASNMKIQTYSSAPSGNPSPGLFAYKTTCMTDPCTSGPIPVAKYYGIHMDVGVWVPDPGFGL